MLQKYALFPSVQRNEPAMPHLNKDSSTLRHISFAIVETKNIFTIKKSNLTLFQGLCQRQSPKRNYASKAIHILRSYLYQQNMIRTYFIVLFHKRKEL